MPDYGLKISKAGYDVKTATDINLIFSSELNTAAIALSGTAQQTGDLTDILTFTITHGLSFIPYALVYVNSSKYPSYWQWCPLAPLSFMGNQDQVYNIDIRVSSTQFILRVLLANDDDDTINIRYYLLNTSI